MRIDTRARLFASLAVLAASGIPVVAYGAGLSAEAVVEQSEAKPNKSNKDVVASWPAEKQAAYATWPAATKDYYWTLSPKRQKLFWGLADTDKVTLSGMSKEERAKAWERIEGRGGTPAGSGR